MFGHPVLKPKRNKFPKHVVMLKLFMKVKKKGKVQRIKKRWRQTSSLFGCLGTSSLPLGWEGRDKYGKFLLSWLVRGCEDREGGGEGE